MNSLAIRFFSFLNYFFHCGNTLTKQIFFPII